MNWSMLALLRAKAAVEERGIKVQSYRDLGYDFLGGDHGSRAVDWCVVGFQFGVCASYFSFMTSTLHAVAPWTFRNFIYRCFSTYRGRALRPQTSKRSRNSGPGRHCDICVRYVPLDSMPYTDSS